ncbi:MAG: BatA and WFA domain-containing protein [Firmicutes bacterium]|nr:BatA and WFA domain-containing protein [Bacillota bacterium]
MGMELLIPFGLFGLIGVVGLIIIYILKPKYQEKQLASTYVWELTLKYQKKKIPFQWLTGSLLFILQILMFILLGLMMAFPVFFFGEESGERIIILDASAHMMATYEGQTRFDRAIQEILALADEASEDTPITIILGTDYPIMLIERSTSPAEIRQMLPLANGTFGSINMDAAINLATDVLNQNPDAEVLFFTGRNYPHPGVTTVIDVSRNEWNAAILSVSHSMDENLNIFTARVASYNRDANLIVRLYIDDAERDSRQIRLTSNAEGVVTWGIDAGISSFSKARFVLIDGNTFTYVEDSFPYDNSFYLFGGELERFNVQIISPRPLIMSNAISATGMANITIAPRVLTPDYTLAGDGTNIEDFEVAMSGYQMYIFDGVTPQELPADGAVWIINPQASIPSIGVAFQNIPGTSDLMNLSLVNHPRYGNAILPATAVGTSHTEIIEPLSIFFSPATPQLIAPHLTQIRNVIGALDFTPLLRVEGTTHNALLMRNMEGQRIFVMPFDMHFSNVHGPFLPVLAANMLNYAIIPTSVETLFNIGDSVTLNARPNVMELRVEHPGGLIQTFEHFPATMRPERPGLFEVQQDIIGGSRAIDNFFVRLSNRESDFSLPGDRIPNPVLTGTGTDRREASRTVDILFWLALAFMVFMSVEWFLQYREQN